MKVKYYCPLCGHEFEQGEYEYNYETAHTDFHCPFCDWEGNETLVDDEEPMREWDEGYDEEHLDARDVMVVPYPESEDIIDRKDFESYAWLINDEEGLTLFGRRAYVVDKDWYFG